MTGFFTPTESAAGRRLRAARWSLLSRHQDSRNPAHRAETVETTGVLMALVMSAALLGYALSMSRLPQEFGGWLTGTVGSQIAYLMMVNVILLIVGCFMEAISAMLILIPILVPPAMALGIDPTQFGVVVVLNLMIGTITLPVGIVLFITAAPTCHSTKCAGNMAICGRWLPFSWRSLSSRH